MLTTFTASCISFAPAEIVSGILLLIASGLIYRWDQAMLQKEAAAVAAAVQPPVTE